MKTLKIHVEVGGDPRIAEEVIRERIEVLPAVERAELEIVEKRQGFVEATALLVGTITLLKLGTVMVTQLRALLRELAALERDLTGAQSIVVEIEGTKYEPDQIDDKTLAKLLEYLAN